MKSCRSSQSPSSRSSALLTTWLLALTLLLLQTFGFVHGVLHRSGPGVASRLMVKASAPHAIGAAKSRLELLFSSHTSDSDCRLYDQASHGGAAANVASLVLPVVLPPLAVAIFQSEALARWAALFDARGPPSTR